jgi:hypothetical protein
VPFESHMFGGFSHLYRPLFSEAIIPTIAKHQDVEITSVLNSLYRRSEEPSDQNDKTFENYYLHAFIVWMSYH